MARLHLSAVVFAFLALASCPASSHAALALTDQAPQDQELQLEVWINGVPTGLIGAFTHSGSGGFSASAAELRTLGLAAPGDAAHLPLDRLPGVSARYDEGDQRLYLTAPDSALEPHHIAVSPRVPVAQPGPAPLGGLLNYQLFAQGGQALSRQGASFAGLSGDFDARAFGPFGAFDNTFAAQVGDPNERVMTRLESNWTWANPAAQVTTEVGDLISGGFDWTRPIRMGGIQLRRDFSLRPDLITMPTPTLSGSAAAPSTLEIFTNGQPVYANAVAPGPFRVTDLPAIEGYSDTQLVLRQADGAMQTVDAQFYVTPQLVRTGLLDFSAETGFARRDFGLRSNDYSSDPIATASARYGLSDTLTLQAHGEGGAGLFLGGLGAARRLSAFGVGEVAFAVSHLNGQTGGQLRMDIEGRYLGFFLGGAYQQSFGQYADLAWATAPRIQYDGVWTTALARPPQRLAQLVVSDAVNLHRLGIEALPVISLAYASETDALSHTQDTVSFSARVSLSRCTVFVTANRAISGQPGVNFFIGLSVPLSPRTTVSAGAESEPSGAGVFVEASREAQPQPGAVGWYAHADLGPQTDLQANASYMTKQGRLQADIDILPAAAQGQVQFSGALIAMDHSVFAAPWVQNAFAVVDAGEPGVAVRFQNRLIGVTNADGRLLAPDLNAYEANAIDIDPSSLPLDAEIDVTHAVATPAYQSGVVVHFDLKHLGAAGLVVLRTPSGAFVAPGSQATLAATGKTFVVGYDGQAYVDALSPSNRLVVDQADGGSCIANFDFRPDPKDPMHVLQAICR